MTRGKDVAGDSNGEPRRRDVELNASDQLLSIGAVNLIILVGSWVCLQSGYGTSVPNVSTWVAVLGIALVAVPWGVATSESWFWRLRRIVTNDGQAQKKNTPPEWVVKSLVFGSTAGTIVALWFLVEETGNFTSPFIPFLTAPALFAPFIAERPRTIIAVSLSVVIAIWMLGGSDVVSARPEDWTYKGVATAMILIAGVVAAIRGRVEQKGSSITRGS